MFTKPISVASLASLATPEGGPQQLCFVPASPEPVFLSLEGFVYPDIAIPSAWDAWGLPSDPFMSHFY